MSGRSDITGCERRPERVSPRKSVRRATVRFRRDAGNHQGQRIAGRAIYSRTHRGRIRIWAGGFFWYTEGNTSYNALQIDVTRGLDHGLQFRANYTWSKDLDINSGLTGAQANNQAQMVLDRNDLRRDWGPSALNVTNQASISATYELPFGRGMHGFEKRMIGGWQIERHRDAAERDSR